MNTSQSKYTANSLNEYTNILKKLGVSRKTIFRGQGNKDWKLEASGERKKLKSHQYHEIWLEYYKNNYKITGEALNSNNDLLNLVVDMQHYRIPTMFLDWTYNALIALYFAVEQTSNDVEPKDGKVFIALSPDIYEPDTDEVKILTEYLSAVYHNQDSQSLESQYKLLKQLHTREQMFFCVPKSNERIRVQAGLFSITLPIDNKKILKKAVDELRLADSSRERNLYKEKMKVTSNFNDFVECINSEIFQQEYPLIDDLLKKDWIGDYIWPKNAKTDIINTIIIPQNNKAEIKKDLENLCHIYARTIYPDFIGYAEYIREKY